MIHDIYLELDEEKYAPPAKLVRISNSHAYRTQGSGEANDAVVYFAFGEYDESTFESRFTSNENQTFTIKTVDLVKSLIALGVLPTGTAMTPQTADPDWKSYAA